MSKNSAVTVNENGAINNEAPASPPQVVIGRVTSGFGYNGRQSLEVSIGGKRHYLEPRTPKEMVFYESLKYMMYVNVRRDSEEKLYVPIAEPHVKQVPTSLVLTEIENRFDVINAVLSRSASHGCAITMDQAIGLAASVMASVQRDGVFDMVGEDLSSPEHWEVVEEL